MIFPERKNRKVSFQKIKMEILQVIEQFKISNSLLAKENICIFKGLEYGYYKFVRVNQFDSMPLDDLMEISPTVEERDKYVKFLINKFFLNYYHPTHYCVSKHFFKTKPIEEFNFYTLYDIFTNKNLKYSINFKTDRHTKKLIEYMFRETKEKMVGELFDQIMRIYSFVFISKIIGVKMQIQKHAQ